MTIIAITLVIVGVLLICLELAMPGFGIFGILGTIATLAGYILGIIYVPHFWVVILITIVIFAILIKYWKFPKKLVLKDESKNLEKRDLSHLVGQKGVVSSILKPVGKCLINNEFFECYSMNGVIEKDQEIIVKEIKDNKIMVQCVEK